jgi:predicted secreted protein
MKRWNSTALIGIALVALAACAGGGKRIEISCDDFYADPAQSGRLEMSPGEQFELVLCSNPTTGFQWEDPPAVSAPTVLEQLGMTFEEPGAGGQSEWVGAPGMQSWTFEALSAGDAQVSLTYSQPWEGGEKGVWSYTLAVTVR